MRLRFDATEEDAAEAARERLVTRFETWLADRPEAGAADPWDADLLLSWKWAYGDGRYDHWTRADVDEVLLEHLPRKLTATTEEAATIPTSLGAFVRFLDEEGLLDPTGDAADAVAARASAQQRAFLDAMADPANFGMGKRLFTLGGFELGDEPDQAALDAAMERFNALPFEERGRILGLDDRPAPDDVPDDLYDLPALPLRSAPPPEVLDALAADVPLLAQVDALHRALGTGATLTKAGNLTMADARRIVAELELGDEVEGVRTSADLPELFAVVQVALLAGAAELDGNRLRPQADWSTRPPAERWEAVVAALLDAGPTSLVIGAYAPVPLDLRELADEGAPHYLAMLWLAEEPVPVADLADVLHVVATTRGVTVAVSLLPDDHWREMAVERVDELLEALVSAGVVTVDGGTVALPDHGARLVAPWLARLGFDVLLPEQVAALDAAAVIDLVVDRDEPVEGVVRLWAPGRPAREAADELLAELAAQPEPVRVGLGFALLQHLGDDAVEAVRAAVDGPLAGHAWLFLASAGAVDRADVPNDLVVGAGIDTFLATAELGSPADAVEPLLGHLLPGDQLAMLDEMATSDHPGTGELLELLGRHHPDKAVGKHARKLAHRWRSGRGTRRGGPGSQS